jgi:hypothetical protein
VHAKLPIVYCARFGIKYGVRLSTLRLLSGGGGAFGFRLNHTIEFVQRHEPDQHPSSRAKKQIPIKNAKIQINASPGKGGDGGGGIFEPTFYCLRCIKT